MRDHRNTLNSSPSLEWEEKRISEKMEEKWREQQVNVFSLFDDEQTNLTLSPSPEEQRCKIKENHYDKSQDPYLYPVCISSINILNFAKTLYSEASCVFGFRSRNKQRVPRGKTSQKFRHVNIFQCSVNLQLRSVEPRKTEETHD